MPTTMLVESRVLIVDDDQDIVLLMKQILEDAGYLHILGLSDPRDVIAAIRDWMPDLILLDVRMPYIDGITLLKTIRSLEGPSEFVPVLVLTAGTERESLKAALHAGANDFLTKPVDIEEFLLRVQNLLVIRMSHEALKQSNTALAERLRRRMRSERLQTEDRKVRLAMNREVIAVGPAMLLQPIIDLNTGLAVGFEALARFPSEQPAEVCFAEAWSLGVGAELELRAVDAALELLGLLGRDEFLAINVSPAVIVEQKFLDTILNVGSNRIVIEVTEHQPVESYEDLALACKQLQDQGIRIAIDDAGAGYASLHHILSLSPDIIKFDISLTRDIDVDPVKRTLVVSLLQFAKDTRAMVIAEGIETEAELATLKTLGVPLGQGFHIARPQDGLKVLKPIYKVG